jgi:hypothetical protein
MGEAAHELPPYLDVDEAPLERDEIDDLVGWAMDTAEASIDVAAVVENANADEPDDVFVDAPERAQRWRIESLGEAEWAAQHAADAADDLAALAEQAGRWREKIDAWFESAAKPLRVELAFFENHLQRYGLRLRAADPKKKSLKLPSGTIKTTSHGQTFEVVDEAAVIEWVETFVPDDVRDEAIAKKVRKTPIGKLCTIDERETGRYVFVYECGHAATENVPECFEPISAEELAEKRPTRTCPECDSAQVVLAMAAELEPCLVWRETEEETGEVVVPAPKGDD